MHPYMTPAEEARFLDDLADYHRLHGWHDCPDGYRWRVTDAQAGGHEGILLGPGGGPLACIHRPDRERCEGEIFRLLDQHRPA